MLFIAKYCTLEKHGINPLTSLTLWFMKLFSRLRRMSYLFSSSLSCQMRIQTGLFSASLNQISNSSSNTGKMRIGQSAKVPLKARK